MLIHYRHIVGILLIHLLVGCSYYFESRVKEYPLVELYDQYLEEAEVHLLSDSLTNRGFRVRRNEIVIPEGIRVPTIVYSPLIEGSRIDQVEDALRELGYGPVQAVYGSTENHSYRSYNLGLYIPPDSR